MRRSGPAVLTLGFGLIALVALWLRVTSLEAIPELNGDEAYEGLQVARLLRGEPFDWLTVNGNPLDPFFVALLAPLLWLFGPTTWALRLPAVLCGIATVVVADRLLRRSLGEAGARIAALLLGTLPLAVVYSRIGHEYSQIPLIGLLTVQTAWVGSPIALIACLAAAALVHPVNAFLVPVVAPIVLVRFWPRLAAAQRPGAGIWAGLALLVAAVVALGAVLWQRPVVQGVIQARPALNGRMFADGLQRALLFEFLVPPDLIGTLARLVVAALIATAASVGLWAAWQGRRWPSLALAIGLLGALTAFHAIAGPDQFGRLGTHRYAVVFLSPLAITLGALLGPLAASLDRRSAGRSLVPIAQLALGLLLLSATYQAAFGPYTRSGRERALTLRPDAREPYRTALRRILTDAAQDPSRADRPIQILGQEYWDCVPIRYLAAGRATVRVDQLIELEDIWIQSQGHEDRFGQKADRVVAALREGAYVVAHASRPAGVGGRVVRDAITAHFAGVAVRVWELPGLRQGSSNDGTGPADLVVLSLEPRALARHERPEVAR